MEPPTGPVQPPDAAAAAAGPGLRQAVLDTGKSSLSAFPIRSASSSLPGSTPGSSTEALNVERLVARVRELEERLDRTIQMRESLGGEPSLPTDEFPEFNRTTMSKTRHMGESHWMNVADMVTSAPRFHEIMPCPNMSQLPLEIALFGRAEQEKGEVYQALGRCKALARIIKESRLRPISSINLGREIPQRNLCDVLVESYLRLFEGVFRIVHIPTFRATYERFWQDPNSVGDAFVIQLQLCMALGSVVQDDVFSLRNQATQWIYEANLWLSLPPEKKVITLAGLQNMCLLVLAKAICAVGSDLAWTAAGTLVRVAMHIGLHRDPSHSSKMSTYEAEMHRRLWATVCELNLQLSFDSGGSPLLSAADYDTQPPANLDDEQLTDDGSVETPIEHPPYVPTRVSVQLALLGSHTLRSSVIKYVNNFRVGESYDATLRLNSQITAASRNMTASLSNLTVNNRPESSWEITSFHIHVAELFMHRCFHALHQPVLMRHLQDPKYYFSRKMQLDSASQVMGKLDLDGMQSNDPSMHELKLLCTNGAGMFHSIPAQALLAVIVELIHSAADQKVSLGYLPSVGENKLRSTLVGGRDWCLARIAAGATNVKAHCFMSACLAHVDALEAGEDLAGIETTVMRAMAESGFQCYAVLKAVAGREGLRVDGGENEQMDMDNMPSNFLDWVGDLAWDDMSDVMGTQLGP